MATKKVLVEINVEQKGSALEKTTKNVKKLTDVEKERLRVKNETKKTDAKLEIINEKATKDLKDKKKALHDLNNAEKIAETAAKKAISTAKQEERQSKAIIAAKLRQADAEYSNKLSIDRQRQSALRSIEIEKLRSEAIENTTQKTDKFKTTSGLTGALVTEFGRAASDSAYGIRGMGNNISQIVTLFGQLQVNVAKAGGTFKDSMNQIFQSMKGIVGVMTALQIVLGVIQQEWFQKWVSGLFNVNTKLKEFKKLMKEASNTAGASQGNFNTYIKVLRDTSSSLEEQQAAIEKLNNEYPDFNTNILTNTNNQDAQNIAVERYNDLLLERARSEAALSKIQESSSRELELIREKDKKAVKLGLKDFKTVSSVAKRLREEQDSIISGRAKGAFGNEEIFVQDGDFGQVKLRKNQLIQLEKLNEEAIKKEKDLQKGLFDFIKIESGKQTTIDKDTLERRVSRFKETRLLLQSELQKSEDDLLKLTVRSNEKIIQDERDSSIRTIKIKVGEFKKREELRLENFVAQKKIDRERKGITQSEKDRIDASIKDAENKSAIAILLAEKESKKVIEAIDNVEKKRQEVRKRAEIVASQDRALKLEEAVGNSSLIETTASGVDLSIIEAQKEQDDLLFENKRFQLEREISLLEGNADEQKKIQDELELYKQKKEDTDFLYAQKVADAKFDLAEQGLTAIGGLFEKNSKEAKVFAATAATINTFQGVSKALAEGGFAGIATGAIVAATGFAQVRNILSTDSPKTSGGDSSSSTTIQPPDFNIVGSTGVNQLADAIGSTEKEPVKAFVVASDVTTQQALDRNNRNNAEL